MIQYIIVGTLILISVSYLARIVFRSFRGQATCDTGCAKCNVEQGPIAQKN